MAAIVRHLYVLNILFAGRAHVLCFCLLCVCVCVRVCMFGERMLSDLHFLGDQVIFAGKFLVGNSGF